MMREYFQNGFPEVFFKRYFTLRINKDVFTSKITSLESEHIRIEAMLRYLIQFDTQTPATETEFVGHISTSEGIHFLEETHKIRRDLDIEFDKLVDSLVAWDKKYLTIDRGICLDCFIFLVSFSLLLYATVESYINRGEVALHSLNNKSNQVNINIGLLVVAVVSLLSTLSSAKNSFLAWHYSPLNQEILLLFNNYMSHLIRVQDSLRALIRGSELSDKAEYNSKVRPIQNYSLTEDSHLYLSRISGRNDFFPNSSSAAIIEPFQQIEKDLKLRHILDYLITEKKLKKQKVLAGNLDLPGYIKDLERNYAVQLKNALKERYDAWVDVDSIAPALEIQLTRVGLEANPTTHIGFAQKHQ